MRRPAREDVRPYLNITVMLETAGVHVPRVYEWDTERGLLLLEDLGTRQYLPALQAGDDADRLYRDALQALADFQVRGRESAQELPPYNREVLVREMALMPEWFCARHLRLELTRGQGEMLTAAFEFLVTEALAQPQVFRPSRLPLAQSHDHPGAQSRRHRLPGRAARPGRIRPGVAAQGLLHQLAARARRRLGARSID